MIRIVNVEPLPGYQLRIRFNDGLEGLFPVHPEKRGGVFQSLQNPDIFNAVRVNEEFGCVEWPGGVDLCPTSMYTEMFGEKTVPLPGNAGVTAASLP